MRHSEKLAKKGKTMVVFGTIAEFVLPVPFVWSTLKKKGAEKITASKLFRVEELTELLVDACEDDPELIKEFMEELETANNNPEIIVEMVKEAMEKREKKEKKSSKDEEKE